MLRIGFGEAKAGEGSLSADTDPSTVADCVRATFSHKGRRKKAPVAASHPGWYQRRPWLKNPKNRKN
jgi:hypothetical protein